MFQCFRIGVFVFVFDLLVMDFAFLCVLGFGLRKVLNALLILLNFVFLSRIFVYSFKLINKLM